MERESAIYLEHVSVQARLPGRGQQSVLRDITLCWRIRQNIGLIGPSGSGKTTLIRLLAHLDRPTSGRIRRPVSARVMVVLQRPEDHFTEEQVGRQVATYSRSVLLPKARVEILTRVGLPEEAIDWPLRQLSSGQQRLVAIACALASDAPFLALDEPMAGLDSQGRMLVRTALRRLVDERSVATLIVSHHPDDLLGLVDRLLLLNHGQLEYDGPIASTPLDSLSRSIGEPEQSVYFTLRQLETGGLRLRSEIYASRDIRQVFRELLVSWSST